MLCLLFQFWGSCIYRKYYPRHNHKLGKKWSTCIHDRQQIKLGKHKVGILHFHFLNAISMLLFKLFELEFWSYFFHFIAFTLPKKKDLGSSQNTYHTERLCKLEVGVKDEAKENNTSTNRMEHQKRLEFQMHVIKSHNFAKNRHHTWS